MSRKTRAMTHANRSLWRASGRSRAAVSSMAAALSQSVPHTSRPRYGVLPVAVGLRDGRPALAARSPGARQPPALPGRGHRGEPADPPPCLLFVDYPGRHDFEYDIAENRQGLLHRALTVGELRKATEHLDDTAAIRIGATADGALPANLNEVQAVAEGAVARRLDGGGQDPALVLLIGLNTMAADQEGGTGFKR
jgi:hypothetical protein